MFVYLAHPIDLAGESSWLGTFLGDLSALLVKAGIGAFRPGMAYLADTGNKRHTQCINEINNIAIWEADGLVAVLPRDVATLGTPVEIESALNVGKPVVVFTDIAHSVQIAAWRDKGATVYQLGDTYETTSFPTTDEMRTALIRRNKIIETEQIGGPPALLVRSDGATNLRRGAYQGDAGIDLAIAEDVRLYPGGYQLVSTGVHVAIPDGYFGWITGRSSAWSRFNLDVRTAIIDSGYRGELKLGVVSHSQTPGLSVWTAGLRLGQLVVLPAYGGAIEVVDELPAHERGTNGYGSSGH